MMPATKSTYVGEIYFRIRLTLGDSSSGFSGWVKTMTNTGGFKLVVGCYDALLNQ